MSLWLSHIPPPPFFHLPLLPTQPDTGAGGRARMKAGKSSFFPSFLPPLLFIIPGRKGRRGIGTRRTVVVGKNARSSSSSFLLLTPYFLCVCGGEKEDGTKYMGLNSNPPPFLLSFLSVFPPSFSEGGKDLTLVSIPFSLAPPFLQGFFFCVYTPGLSHLPRATERRVKKILAEK